jgi:probable HAF family extracellular repeat protein
MLGHWPRHKWAYGIRIFVCLVGWLGSTNALNARTYYRAKPMPPALRNGGGIGINNLGQLTGVVTDDQGTTHGIVVDGDQWRDIGGLGGTSCQPTAINIAGEVVGVATTPERKSVAFHFNGTSLIPLTSPAGTSLSIASAINGKGAICGWIERPPSVLGGVWKGEAFSEIPSLGGSFTYATAINDVQHVAGWSYVSDGAPFHAFLFKDGATIDLGTGGGRASAAFGINNSDQVVGYIDVAAGVRHPMVWEAGIMKDLGTLGGPFGTARAISNKGVIVGSTFTTANGLAHGFVFEGGMMTDLNDVTQTGDTGIIVIEDAFAINDSGAILCNASTKSSSSTYLLVPVDGESQLKNFSIRAKVSDGEGTVIIGFFISGSRSVLIRGVGPSLAAYGVQRPDADPRIAVYGDKGLLLQNDNWGSSANSPEVVAASRGVGAFDLPDGSKDGALAQVLAAGTYTVHLTAAVPSGIGLAELYDTSAARDSRMTNFSARTIVASDEETAIAGFVISGDAPKTVLLRAIGPALAAYGVVTYLKDPKLTVYSGTLPIANNNDWSEFPATENLKASQIRSGAFSLLPNSKDAAIVLTLWPGNYTLHATSMDGTAGVVLIEAFDVL